MSFYETKHGVIIKVSVKPRSKEFKIVAEGDKITVFCKEEPVKGKVNRELVKEFSRLLHKRVELVSGFTSKRKRLLIKNADGGEVKRFLFQK
jgi:uncharacterized protein (TIGR00251 family)